MARHVSLGIALACALVLFPNSATAGVPQQLFALVSSGMLFVRSSCNSGSYTASGFLVGPQTMITALHVVQDPDGSSCSVSARQQDTELTANETEYSSWDVQDPSDAPVTDLAVVELDTPLTGYYFKLSPSSPRAGERVVALGYSFGNELSLNQGRVVGSTRTGTVPVLLFNLLGAEGSSGGPILNLRGFVIGLTQRGATSSSTGRIESLNLAQFVHGQPSSLCDGVARKTANTLCGTLTSLPHSGGSGPPPSAQAPLDVADVWFSAENSGDPSKKLFQIPAQSTRVYVIARFNRVATSADRTTLSFDIRSPDGTSYASKDFDINPSTAGWSYFALTIDINGASGLAPMAGQWTTRVSLSGGSTKSFALSVQRYDNPFDVAVSPSSSFVPGYQGISLTWRLRQQVPQGDTYIVELVAPSGKVADFGTMYPTVYLNGYEYLSTYCFSGTYIDTCEYGTWTVRIRRNADTIWSTSLQGSH